MRDSTSKPSIPPKRIQNPSQVSTRISISLLKPNGFPTEKQKYTGTGFSVAGALKDTNTFSASGITSGSLYVSFLIDCTTANVGGNYLLSITPGNSPSGGSDPLAIYTGSTGTGWKIGIRHQGVTTGATYATTTLALNTVYFVVAEYQFVDGTANDIVNLYLNPVPGGALPATPSASQQFGTGPVDASSLNSVGFRVGQTTTAGNYIFDDLRIWEIPEPSSFVVFGLGSLVVAMGYRRMRR